MKDNILLLKDEKVKEKNFKRAGKPISLKYWLGWAGGYGNAKKE